MKKTLSVLLAGAMLAGALAGCGNGGNGAGSTDESNPNAFKIGGTGPLTGTNAIYGNAVKNGAELAVEEINAEGGIQFDLKIEDDEGLGHAAVSGIRYQQTC